MSFLSFLIKLIVVVAWLPECQEFRYERGDILRTTLTSSMNSTSLALIFFHVETNEAKTKT